MRYLPDASVLLLEVTGARRIEVDNVNAALLVRVRH
jgi:hypothetical protein